MNEAKTFDTEFDLELPPYGTVTVHITGTRTAIHEATMYNSHGDPGEPAEGGELEYDTVEVFDDEGNDITGKVGHILSQFKLDDKANEDCENA